MRLQQKKPLTTVNSLITQKARHRWTFFYFFIFKIRYFVGRAVEGQVTIKLRISPRRYSLHRGHVRPPLRRLPQEIGVV